MHKSRWIRLLVISTLLLVAFCPQAFAQGFDFGGGETTPDPNSGGGFDFGGGETPPDPNGGGFDFGGGGDNGGDKKAYTIDESSQTFQFMSDAERFSEANDHFKASLLFYKVIQAEDDTALALRPKANYELARTLYQLGLPQSSLTRFDQILNDGSENEYFLPTLKWLVLISEDLPGDPDTLDRVFRNYKDFYQNVEASVQPDLALLLGQAAYQQGTTDEAIRFLSYVPPTHKQFLKAKFLEGVSHVRDYKAEPASKAFKEILSFVEQQPTLTPELLRYRELAIISMARVFYSVGSGLYTQKDRAKAINSWNTAIKYYSTFSRSSVHWLDSLFEASWTYYRAGDFNHALGLLHTLNSPFFNDRYYPEAMLLQAYIYYTNCHFDRVQDIVKEFRETYEPLQVKLDETLTNFLAPEDVYKFLLDIYANRVAFDPILKQVLNAALQDKAIARTLRYIRRIEKEADRIGAADPGWSQSDLAVNLIQELEYTKNNAQAAAGKIAKQRLERIKDEISNLIQKALAADVETTSRYAEMIPASAIPQEVLDAQQADIKAVIDSSDKHQYWAFDGEFWQDELGYYLYYIADRCGN
jgi:hypothetical protein